MASEIPADLLETLKQKDTKQLEEIKSLISKAEVSNNEKLHFIKGEIKSGRYKHDSLEIATKMIAELVELEEVEA